jgi:LacI family transcriptional regulator
MVEYLKEGMPIDAVYQDNDGGVAQAMDRLSELGHTRIGLVAWDAGAFQPLARRAAFASWLLQRGDLGNGRVGMSRRFDAEGGREAVRQLYRANGGPTALVLSHLEMAEGVFEELTTRGRKPGRDVSIVASGTPEYQHTCLAGTRWADFPLDMVEWSRAQMGRTLVRVIEARMQDPAMPPLRVPIPTELVSRGSCRRVRRREAKRE